MLNTVEKQRVMRDIRDFDKEYEIILHELKKFPDDERLKNGLIDYYRSKSEFLEGILNQINSANLIII
jgi:hypothetical protein